MVMDTATKKSGTDFTSLLPKNWELYSSLPGHGAAERRLNKAALSAAAKLERMLLKHVDPVHAVSECFHKGLYKTMTTLIKFGATDTEPYYHGRTFLTRVAAQVNKLDEWERRNLADKI
jgi:hypothetical protein